MSELFFSMRGQHCFGEACMNLDSLTTPSEETVAEYVSVFQNIDWQTGLKGVLILVIGLLAVKLVMRLVTRGLQRSHKSF